MLKIILILALVGSIYPQDDKDLDSVIESIFGKPSSTQPPFINVKKPSTIVPPTNNQDKENQPCQTEEGKEGRCLRYFLCNSNNTVIDDVASIPTLKVRAGEWDTQTSKEIYPFQDRDVDSIIIHKDYNHVKKNLFYDIALLFLSSPVDMNVPNVALACLPPPRLVTPGGIRCFASGWGKDKFGKEGRYQVILKKVSIH
nr:phenoloxidase-activating factor 2-like [Danaus plexippus plexippus]